MNATEREYQAIVDARFKSRVEARVRALAHRARADARRAERHSAIPKRTEMRVFQTNNGPVYQVEKLLRLRGPIGGEIMHISLPYLSIQGHETPA